MSEKDRRGDRPKKSWRDIDANRDRNRAPGDRGSPAPGRPGNTSDVASKQHRAALEAMFAKGEVGKLAEKMGAPSAASTPVRAAPLAAPPPPQPSPEVNARLLLRKKILEAVGRDPISRAVDKYVDGHGLPADFEVLEQALEHTKESRVAEVLSKLETMLEKEKPRRSRTLAGKLRFLEETSPDEELRTCAARIRTKLG